MLVPFARRRATLAGIVGAAVCAAMSVTAPQAQAASSAAAPTSAAAASSAALSAAATTSAYSDTPLKSWRTNGIGYAAVIVGNTVYIGGAFDRVIAPGGAQKLTRRNLAAFNLTTGALVTAFDANVDGNVRALSSDGNRLYIGGAFSHVGGQSRQRVAAVDLATGAVSSWTANASGTVYAVHVRNGVVYVGGSFGKLKGTARQNLGAFSASDGSLSPSWTPSADGTVFAISSTSSGSSIYLGGSFRAINGNGTYGDRLAAVAPSGSLQAVDFKGVDNTVLALDVSDDNSKVAASTTSNKTSVWSVGGGKSWSQQCDGDSQAVTVIGSNVYSGFHDGCGGVTGDKLIVNALSGGARDTSFHPEMSPFYGVRGLTGNSSRLVAAGTIQMAHGVTLGGFAIYPAL